MGLTEEKSALTPILRWLMTILLERFRHHQLFDPNPQWTIVCARNG